jgi:hypothetical protein
LFLWEIIRRLLGRADPKPTFIRSLALLLPAVPLILWYAYHYSKTGYIFGNPEFFRYNVRGTLQPLRIVLALLLRLWQTFGYMSLYLLTAAVAFAMWRRPRPDPTGVGERPRINTDTQLAFLTVTAFYIIAMAVVGGAVLARYMLPIVPLVLIVWISTLWRRVKYWKAVVTLVGMTFALSLFVNPPYGFSLEDNLAYRDYILLHQRAQSYLEQRFPRARVLTAWPANDELTRPILGYVKQPFRVVRIEDFTSEQLMSAAELRSEYDVALVFSTKYEPPRSLLENWPTWQRTKARFFGYHRDLPPAVAARFLGGEVVYSESRGGQWIAVIELQKIVEARLR